MSSPNRPSRPGVRGLPWRALVVLVVVVLVGLLPLARNLLDRRDELLATNTRAPVSPTAETVRPGARSCADVRRDDFLNVPADTTAIRIYPAYTNRLVPQLTISLLGGGETVRGRSPQAYPSGAPLTLRLDRAAPAGVDRICVRNSGPSTVTLARAVDAGGNDRAVPLDQGAPDRPAKVRSTVRFDLIGRRDAVAASLVGEALDNAGTYKPDGVGPVVIGAGMLLVLLGGAAGIALVLRSPDDEEPGAPAPASPTAGPAPGTSGSTSAAAPATGTTSPAAARERDRGGW